MKIGNRQGKNGKRQKPDRKQKRRITADILITATAALSISIAGGGSEYRTWHNPYTTIKAYAQGYEYDGLGRVIKVTEDDGSIWTYEYDANGNILRYTYEPVTTEPETEKERETEKETDKESQTYSETESEKHTEKETERGTSKQPENEKHTEKGTESGTAKPTESKSRIESTKTGESENRTANPTENKSHTENENDRESYSGTETGAAGSLIKNGQEGTAVEPQEVLDAEPAEAQNKELSGEYGQENKTQMQTGQRENAAEKTKEALTQTVTQTPQGKTLIIGVIIISVAITIVISALGKTAKGKNKNEENNHTEKQ